MKHYSIEKSFTLGCWIVWECHRNYKVDRHHGRTKEECEEWLNRKKKVKNEK